VRSTLEDQIAADTAAHGKGRPATPSAVSERVSDERLAELIKLYTPGACDSNCVGDEQDTIDAIRELQRLRHGSRELVEALEAARVEFEYLGNRRDLPLDDRNRWTALARNCALANHARLSPEGSDEASSHNQP
jgi:hypothetical protein